MANFYSWPPQNFHHEPQYAFSRNMFWNSSTVPVEKFPFHKLPDSIAKDVVKKLTLKEFLRLRSSSRHGYALCRQIRTRYEHHFTTVEILKRNVRAKKWAWKEGKCDIPWSLATTDNVRLNAGELVVNSRLTSDRCERLYKSFLYKQFSAVRFAFRQLPECSAEDIIKLLEVVDAKALDSTVYLSPEIFDSAVVKAMESLFLGSCRISDKQFSALTAIDITMTNDLLSAKAINELLKQWKYGNRELNEVEIRFETTTGVRSADDILEGLDANLVWSPASHHGTLISAIPLPEIREMWTTHPRSFYSIWRSDCIHNPFTVEISADQFTLLYDDIEMGIFYEMLTADQFHTAFKECKMCAIRYCEHHPGVDCWFRKFPLCWKTLLAIADVSNMYLQFVNEFYYRR